jgi:parallel beta-helix repeat protein
MNIKFYSIFIFLLIIVSLIPNYYAISNNSIIIVDDEGDGDYTKIQDAIDNSEIGDTIEVYSGNYEETVVINKKLNLIGIPYEFDEGSDIDKPIIDANSGTQSAVTITAGAKSCTFSGFHLKRSNFAMILVNSDYNIITDNYFSGDMNRDEYGIIIRNSDYNEIFNNSMNGRKYCLYLESSTFNIIKENEIKNANICIDLDSSLNNILLENQILYASLCGIRLTYNSSNNSIIKNQINKDVQGNYNSGIAIGFSSNANIVVDNYIHGVIWPLVIAYCENIKIINNTIYSNNGGFSLYSSLNTNFSYNYLEGSWWGIQMWGEDCFNTQITNNVLFDNQYTLTIHQCVNTIIRKNNFENNYVSLILDCARDTYVEKNNFINSRNEHAYVCWPIWFPIPKPPKNNQFDSNYWDDLTDSNPRPIPIRLSFYDAYFPRQLRYSVTFDENPALIPYDIP